MKISPRSETRRHGSFEATDKTVYYKNQSTATVQITAVKFIVVSYEVVVVIYNSLLSQSILFSLLSGRNSTGPSSLSGKHHILLLKSLNPLCF